MQYSQIPHEIQVLCEFPIAKKNFLNEVGNAEDETKRLLVNRIFIKNGSKKQWNLLSENKIHMCTHTHTKN